MALTKATYSMVSGAPFNVLDYGADSTGATDSTAAINSAITAANAAGGGEVYFPSGLYLIGTTTHVVLLSNVTLTGDGLSSKIKLADNTPISASLSAITAASRTNIAVKNLYLDGNRANQVNLVGLLRIDTCTDVEVSENTFVDCNNVCVYFVNGTSRVLCVNNTMIDSNGTNIKLGHENTDVVIDGNVLVDTGTYAAHSDGFIMTRFGTTGQKNIVISNNTMRSPTGSGLVLGIWLRSGNNITISGNVLEIADAVGVQVQAEADMHDLSIVGNVINCAAAINIQDSSAGQDIVRLTINGNSLSSVNSTAIYAAPVYASTFSEVSITGNTINTTMNGAADKGIQLTSEGAVVSNNTINMTGSAAGDGISVASALVSITGNNINMGGVGSRGIITFGSYNNITGNIVKGTASYGIRCDAATDYVAVVANVLNSCTLGVLNGGVNSITASNIA
jgi:putative cofactor-binding repeat protein